MTIPASMNQRSPLEITTSFEGFEVSHLPTPQKEMLIPPPVPSDIRNNNNKKQSNNLRKNLQVKNSTTSTTTSAPSLPLSSQQQEEIFHTACEYCRQGQQGQPQEAINWFGRAIPLLEASLGRYHGHVATVYSWMGYLQYQTLQSESSNNNETLFSSCFLNLLLAHRIRLWNQLSCTSETENNAADCVTSGSGGAFVGDDSASSTDSTRLAIQTLLVASDAHLHQLEQNLIQSIQAEQSGDACSSNHTQQALGYYQQAIDAERELFRMTKVTAGRTVSWLWYKMGLLCNDKESVTYLRKALSVTVNVAAAFITDRTKIRQEYRKRLQAILPQRCLDVYMDVLEVSLRHELVGDEHVQNYQQSKSTSSGDWLGKARYEYQQSIDVETQVLPPTHRDLVSHLITKLAWVNREAQSQKCDSSSLFNNDPRVDYLIQSMLSLDPHDVHDRYHNNNDNNNATHHSIGDCDSVISCLSSRPASPRPQEQHCSVTPLQQESQATATATSSSSSSSVLARPSAARLSPSQDSSSFLLGSLARRVVIQNNVSNLVSPSSSFSSSKHQPPNSSQDDDNNSDPVSIESNTSVQRISLGNCDTSHSAISFSKCSSSCDQDVRTLRQHVALAKKKARLAETRFRRVFAESMDKTASLCASSTVETSSTSTSSTVETSLSQEEFEQQQRRISLQEQDIRDNKNTIEQLRRQLDEATYDLEKSEGDKNSMVKSLQQQVQDTTNELKQLQVELHSCKKITSVLTQENCELQKSNKELQQEKCVIETSLTDAANEASALKAQNNMMSQRVGSLEGQLTEAEQKLQEASSECSELRIKNDRLKQGIMTLKKTQIQLESQVQKVIAQAKEMKEERKSSSSKLSEANQRCLELETRLEETNSKVADLTATKTNLIDEIASIKVTKEKVERELLDTQENLQLLQEDSSTKSQQLLELVNTKESLQKEMEQSEATNVSLKNQIEFLTERVKQLEEAKANTDKATKDMENMVVTLTSEKKSITQRLDASRSAHDELDEQLSLRKDHYERELASLRKEKEQLEETLKQRASENEQLQLSRAELVKKLSEIQQAHSDLVRMLDSKQTVLNEEKSENKSLHGELLALQQTKLEFEQLLLEAERDNAALLTEKEDLAQHLKLLQDARHDAEQRLHEVQEESQRHKDQLWQSNVQAERRLEELQDQNKVELEALIDEKARTEESLEASKVAHQQVKQELAKLQSENANVDALEPTAEKYDGVLREVKEANKALKLEIEILVQQKSDLERFLKAERKKHRSMERLRSLNNHASDVIRKLSHELMKSNELRKRAEEQCKQLKESLVELQEEIKENWVPKESSPQSDTRDLMGFGNEDAFQQTDLLSSYDAHAAEIFVFADELSNQADVSMRAYSDTSTADGSSVCVNEPDSPMLKGGGRDLVQVVEDEDNLQCFMKAVRTLPHTYKSELATYIIRRPNDPSNRDLFLLGASESLYAANAQVNDPSTIEVVAKISCDGSLLLLTHQSDVRHKSSDGVWNDLGNSERRDHSLGWVSSKSVTTGSDVDYSLDEVLEGALVFREQYCQSIISALSTSEQGKIKSQNLLFSMVMDSASSLLSGYFGIYKRNENGIKEPLPGIPQLLGGAGQ